MELEVTYTLKDSGGTTVQTAMQIFDDAELTSGNFGATIEILYDKALEEVYHVGHSPRDRK